MLEERHISGTVPVSQRTGDTETGGGGSHMLFCLRLRAERMVCVLSAMVTSKETSRGTHCLDRPPVRHCFIGRPYTCPYFSLYRKF